jgi:hypothetical protein
MSSFPGYKGYSQIDSRSEYLLTIIDTSGVSQLSIPSTVANSNYIINYDGTILNTTDASAVLSELLIGGGINIAAPLQLRDMGKILYVQEDGVLVYKFRLVQPVNGPITEGVPGNYPTANMYVCTWSADPATLVVRVARIG